ncbi:MAG: patatin-like phospholipase family protein [Chloroflexi bacterium]|nr:patatin-like phospholipase family protein [Chloroflexota bacterium]
MGQLEAKGGLALVLSGGGVYGFAHIGTLRALEDLQPHLLGAIETVIGTSVGSIIGALFARGYTPSQIWQIASQDVWARAKSSGSQPRLGVFFDIDYAAIRQALSQDWRAFTGLIKGDRFLDLLDLYLGSTSPLPPEGPARELVTIGMNYSSGREALFHFSRHLAETRATGIPVPATPSIIKARGRAGGYQVYDDLSDGSYNPQPVTMAQAVRCSISLPGIFEPYWLSYLANDGPVSPDTGGGASAPVRRISGWYIDGGVRDNFGISVAAHLLEADQIFGQFLGNADSAPLILDGGMPQILLRIINAGGRTIFEADQDDAAIRTANVRVLLPGIDQKGGTFDLKQMDEIYRTGYTFTRSFLETMEDIWGPPLTWEKIFRQPPQGIRWPQFRPAPGRMPASPDKNPGGDARLTNYPMPLAHPEGFQTAKITGEETGGNYYLFVPPPAVVSPPPDDGSKPPIISGPNKSQQLLLFLGILLLVLAVSGCLWLVFGLWQHAWRTLIVITLLAGGIVAISLTLLRQRLKETIEQALG